MALRREEGADWVDLTDRFPGQERSCGPVNGLHLSDCTGLPRLLAGVAEVATDKENKTISIIPQLDGQAYKVPEYKRTLMRVGREEGVDWVDLADRFLVHERRLWVSDGLHLSDCTGLPRLLAAVAKVATDKKSKTISILPWLDGQAYKVPEYNRALRRVAREKGADWIDLACRFPV